MRIEVRRIVGRTTLVAVLAFLEANAAMAQAQLSSQHSSNNRIAYEHTMQCFVANITAAELRRRNGDTAGGAQFDANAQRSYNYLEALRRRLNLTEQQRDRDIDALSARDASRLTADRSYVAQTIERCRRLGLM